MKPLAITLGDPAGIGSEVVFKALERIDTATPLWIFGDWNLTRQALDELGLSVNVERATDLESARSSRATRLFVDVGDFGEESLRFGEIDARYGAVSLRAIEVALAAIDEGLCSGLVTGPIHKQAWKAAGSPFFGHTELLASHCGLTNYARDYAMYFESPSLRVVLLSVHVSLTEAILRITPETVTALAVLTHQEFGNFYGRAPKIAVAGLNPHAGEGGMFGEEEMMIREGVRKASHLGLSISGPHAPDTIFHAATEGEHDIVMAMYHDQGLIAIKTRHFRESVNVTLGLTFLRASVDHGTAFDIAGRGVADPGPMQYAIEWAIEHL